MNKKSLVLIVLLASALVLIVAFLFNRTSTTPTTSKSTTDVCETIEFPKLRSICYASILEDLEVCGEFEWNYVKLCANAVFSEKVVSEELCNGIENDEIRYVCLKKLSVLKNDFELCEDDSCYFFYSTQESCDKIESDYLRYFCIAKATGDLSICDQFEDEYERRECSSMFSKNIGDCNIGEWPVPICVIKVSKNTGNWQHCIDLSTEHLRARCIALASDDINNCDNLGEYEKDLCKIIFMGKSLEVLYD